MIRRIVLAALAAFLPFGALADTQLSTTAGPGLSYNTGTHLFTVSGIPSVGTSALLCGSGGVGIAQTCAASAYVASVAGLTGTPSASALMTALSAAPLASPTFTGTVTIPSGASIVGFAPLASPALTGVPTAPTATAGTNTTQLATTAFVLANGGSYTLPTASTTVLGGVKIDGTTITIAGGVISAAAAPVTSVAGRTGAITLANSDVTGSAPLASPALTGTPTAPTATVGTNTTQIATTAFVIANAGSSSNLNPISNTYTTSGAINPADTLSILSGSSTLAMTLAAAADTHTVTVNNQGTATNTVQMVLNGRTQIVTLNPGDVANVAYEPLSTPTYIRIN